MSKNKAYVVWSGRSPGVYDTWAETESQVKGYSGARFKGFPSRDAAVAAFHGANEAQNTSFKPSQCTHSSQTSSYPKGTFLTVDAAFSGKTHILEWRGVMVEAGKQTEVFRSPEHQGGSANVGEYLAIVQGIQYLIDNNLSIPLYSDSYNAQKWVRDCQHNSNVSASRQIQELLQEANSFLKGGGYKNVAHLIEIRDWKSREWNDIPADFNRK